LPNNLAGLRFLNKGMWEGTTELTRLAFALVCDGDPLMYEFVYRRKQRN